MVSIIANAFVVVAAPLVVSAQGVPNTAATIVAAPIATASTTALVPVPSDLRGRSGRLMTRLVRPKEVAALGIDPIARVFGEKVFERPAVWTVADSNGAEPFNFISLVPFEAKKDGKVGLYRVGRWPAESGRLISDAYRVPAGFIEVTPENQDMKVSTHFKLRDFLTKDQATVWPKALVLDERLLDKLELIVQELRLAGHKANGLTVMSGFRTPQYNARGVRSGRATNSRHQYGDAADVFVDADGDGRMDDLNRDGKINRLDAQEFLKIIERVDRKYPELVGGAGIYRSTPSHGPYVHVDTRGQRIRW